MRTVRASSGVIAPLSGRERRIGVGWSLARSDDDAVAREECLEVGAGVVDRDVRLLIGVRVVDSGDRAVSADAAGVGVDAVFEAHELVDATAEMRRVDAGAAERIPDGALTEDGRLSLERRRLVVGEEQVPETLREESGEACVELQDVGVLVALAIDERCRDLYKRQAVDARDRVEARVSHALSEIAGHAELYGEGGTAARVETRH